ncbi:MAG TPA: glycosyltransferase N-terminal domain-containing protein [Puia sp.]|nr:glycosyltransferase N-terminal domain-containing protein [Puia sp.]
MTIIFYHVFLWLYNAGISLISPWNRKAKLWLEGRKGLLERIRVEMKAEATGSRPGRPNPGGKTIWMHCSSLGEFEQGRPLLESLRLRDPGCRVVLSFFSPSGYEARKDYAGADHVFYLPLDSRRHARRFIDLVKPELVLWVKYDYWYYYLVELKKRNIPTLLVSGVFRKDQPFFRWYGRLHRYMLECFTHLFVQTEDSKKLLARLGLTGNVTVSGDTRFDRVIGIAKNAESLPLIAAFCGDQPVIIAGSTWEEDEEELDHYANTHPEIRMIIAPHEIGEERLREVERLFRYCIRYSEWAETAAGSRRQTDNQTPASGGKTGQNPGGREPNVLIINNIGMLSRLYQYATITYVGGGFGDDGVHNVLEAAVYGKPVVFGPVIEKYIEAVELVDSGGGIVIDSALEAESVFDRLLSHPEERRETGEASRSYVYAKKGATEKIVGYIQENRLLTN